MKKLLSFALTLSLTSIALPALGDGTLSLKKATVLQVLRIYSDLSDLELVISPSATNQAKTITLDINPPVPRKEAAKKVEAALREQADVVITLIDEKKARAEKLKAGK